jgi:AraC-like DNA-binding protein
MGQISHFSSYLDDKLLPVSQVESRFCAAQNVTLSLVSHAPSYGVYYDPIEDLIISIVIESQHSEVVRDVGYGRQSFMESAGCVLVTPPKQRLYWYFERTPLVLHLSVPPERMRKFLEINDIQDGALLFQQLARQPIYDPLIPQLATRMWSALSDDECYSDIFFKQALGMLMTLVIGDRADQRAVSRLGPGLAPWRLKRVTSLMAENIQRGLSVEEMAKSVNLSTDHFVKAFAASTGRTPYLWHTEMKMEAAKRMLRESNMAITAIALAVGYSSSAHFSTRFRQVVGVTPRTWRKEFSSPQADAAALDAAR